MIKFTYFVHYTCFNYAPKFQRYTCISRPIVYVFGHNLAVKLPARPSNIKAYMCAKFVWSVHKI